MLQYWLFEVQCMSIIINTHITSSPPKFYRVQNNAKPSCHYLLDVLRSWDVRLLRKPESGDREDLEVRSFIRSVSLSSSTSGTGPRTCTYVDMCRQTHRNTCRVMINTQTKDGAERRRGKRNKRL